MIGAIKALLVASVAVTACEAWARPPAGKASVRDTDRFVMLFRDVCVANLGQSKAMSPAIQRSRLGFRRTFAGDKDFGPIWTSAHGRISATDHSHNHDGEECELRLRRQVAPTAAATIQSLRRHKLVTGSGLAAEFGATVFRSGKRTIMVRYDIPSKATGVREADAGLTLLIQQPPA